MEVFPVKDMFFLHQILLVINEVFHALESQNRCIFKIKQDLSAPKSEKAKSL